MYPIPPDAPAAGASTIGHPNSVFLSWSGRDSQAIATALKALLCAIDAARVDPFHSDDMEAADPWREQIRKAVARSRVAVICLVPPSLSSTWLMYEAGAFFEGRDTYLLACGVDDAELKKTPLEAFQRKDARNKTSVKGLARLLVRPADADMAAFEARFDEAWGAFAQVVDRIHRTQEAARQRRRFARLAVAPVALSLVAACVAVWWFRVPLRCAVSAPATCADIRWAAFVAESTTKANPNLDKKVSRRPFAVIAVGGACTRGELIPWATIVGPTGTIAATHVPVIFARSNYDMNEKVAAAVVLGDARTTTLLDAACQVGPGGQVIHVAYIGTLSDDRLCEKALAFDRFFQSRRAMATELAAFLSTLGVPANPSPQRQVDEWLRGCGVPEHPDRQATVMTDPIQQAHR